MMATDDQKDYEIRYTPPAAARTMRGMSRAGYTPMTALADVLDNSIAAGATRIKIVTEHLVGGSTRVFIVDNGWGMTPDVLEQAMKFGSRKDLANSELSVYGLGMKIASLEISREGFTVLSRDEFGVVSSASWDLGDQEEHEWGLRWYKNHNPTFLAYLNDVSGANGSGTVVVWDKADLSDADQFVKAVGGKDRRNARIEARLIEHLGLTFHRWIDGQVEGKEAVRIVFNGNRVESWNPLNPLFEDAELVQPIAPFPLELHLKNQAQIEKTQVVLRPWIMRTDLSKNEKDELAKRKQKWQGIYVYRLDRVIQKPGWLDFIDARHNALNGLRFALEITPAMDDFLSLDVKKSSVLLPEALSDALRPHIEEYERIEQNRSDKARQRQVISSTPQDLLDRTGSKLREVSTRAGSPDFETKSETVVVVKNVNGQYEHRVKPLPITTQSDLMVDWVDTLDDGVLWETHYGPNHDVRIRINQSHDFFQKVLAPLQSVPLAWEGIVQILWAFSRAEFDSVRGDKTQFADMRNYMSKTLRYFADEIETDDTDALGDDAS